MTAGAKGHVRAHEHTLKQNNNFFPPRQDKFCSVSNCVNLTSPEHHRGRTSKVKPQNTVEKEQIGRALFPNNI